ncbi:uncharacterized protein P884DRAFT_233076 [Thermothelomyces heterothallicus CBS 202.75]|uniref:uncharacterized protein n=1 Tax=Thermothelomyces heterothallicus CBS 202.75 TaxID=1149848 RepID=UPI003744933B
MSPAVFQIVSDLHLETQASYEYNFKQTAPNLALLGDIGQVADDGLFTFLEKQLRRYWNVFFLLGNHEPTSGSWPSARRRVRAFAERMERLRERSTIGRFVFLDRTRHDLDGGLTVLGCTLFSRVLPDQAAAVAGRLVDFRKITGWTVEDHVDAHLADLRWLNEQVEAIARAEPGRQIVVFTHHSPTADERATDPRHRDSPVASGFATDLGREPCWTSPAVVLWAFGHTHFCCDFVDEHGKRVVANQRGYALARESAFDAAKTFVVGRAEAASGASSMLLF